MKSIIAIFISSFFTLTSFSQDWESMGSGIIDFFLTNPQTANETNMTEQAALRVIGNLLTESSKRKHEINVATAGRNEIVINTDNGNKGTVYSDINGNIYLLFNNTIYPLSENLVSQAKIQYVYPNTNTFDNNKDSFTTNPGVLPKYDLKKLSASYNFETTTQYAIVDTLERYYLTLTTEKLSLIASRLDISKDDIYFQAYKIHNGEPKYDNLTFNIPQMINWIDGYSGPKSTIKSIISKLNNVYYSRTPLRKNDFGCSNFIPPGLLRGYSVNISGIKDAVFPDGFAIYVQRKIKVPYKVYPTKLISAFSCNWAVDFDGNGFSFDEFNGIKRTFYLEEKVLLAMSYTTEKTCSWKLEVYEAMTGDKVCYTYGSTDSNAGTVTSDISSKELPSGIYLYNFTIKAPDGQVDSKSEKFEIIDKSD